MFVRRKTAITTPTISHYQKLLAICVLMLACLPLVAQDYKYYIYKVKNGLPTDIVKDVNKDDAGFLWIATDDGLVKFDGERFVTYKSALRSQFAKRLLRGRDGRLYAIGDLDLIEIINKIDTVVFRSIRMGTRNPSDSTLWYPKSLYEDHNGSLWVGELQSVARIGNGTFKRFGFDKKDLSTQFTRSFSFMEDKTGTLYCVSYTGNVYALQPDGLAFEHRYRFPNGVNDVRVLDDILWVAADDGLYAAELLPDGGFNKLDKLASMTSPSCITPIGNDRLLINTFNTDQYTYHRTSRKLNRFPYPLRDVNTVFALQDELFISTSEGLVLLQNNLFHAVHSPQVENNFIESVTEDVEQGDIYFATLETIFKIHAEGAISNYPKIIDHRPGDSYQSILLHQGRLWASDGQSLLLYENDRLKQQWNLADRGRYIYDLSADDAGNLWVSQDGNPAAQYITPSFQFETVAIPLAPQSSLNAIRQTPSGLYALSGGVDSYLFSRKDSTGFVNVSVAPQFNVQSDLSIVDLVEVRGVLYLASSEGLLRYTPGGLKRIEIGNLYTSLAVMCIKQLSEQELLFANSSGLFRYNLDTQEWWTYNEANGLPTNTIHSDGLLIDHNHNVWVGTSKGIAFSDHPITDATTTTTPWISQVFVNGRKRMFMDGLSVEYGSFIDIELATNVFPSNAVALQYRMATDSTWTSLENSRVRLSDMSPGLHTAQIRAKNSGSYSWSKPRLLAISVRKAFWQEYWFFATVGMTLLLVSLGSFTFARRIARKRRSKLEQLLEQITSKNDQLERQAAEINEAHKALQNLYEKVDKQREELQHQSTKLLVANESLTKLSRDLQEKNEEIQTQSEELIESNETIRQLNDTLEKKVHEKSKDLILANEELSKRNADLLQFSYSISHNLRGPVARLLGLTTLLSDIQANGESTELLKMINSSAHELDTVLHDLTHIIEIRKDISNIRNKVKFEDEWNRCRAMLSDQDLNKFDIQADFSECPVIFSVRGLIQSILYNLFSNAIKYRSPDRKLTIRAKTRRSDNKTYFEISDNGLGIDLSEQNGKLFKLYKRFHTHVPGKGLGLYLVKTQTELLGGTIEVTSGLNEGTRFQLILPDPESIEHQVIFDNETAALFYDANVNCTVINWKKQVTAESYHRVFEAVLHSLRTYHSPGWIADLRNQGVVPTKEQVWFTSRVLPEAVKNGLKRVASIGFSTEEKAPYYNLMRQKAQELGFLFQDFDSLPNALEWMAGGYRGD